MRVLKIGLLGIIVALISVSCQSKAVNPVVFQTHKLDFSINVDNQSASFVDQGLMQVFHGANLLYLSPSAKISELLINEKQVEFMVLDTNRLSELDSGLGVKILALEPPKEALWVLFNYNTSETTEFSLSYSATFDANVEDAKFSNQNVGREITATILEKGAYFSPSSYYYPRGNDGLMNFELTATIPANWESIADGNSVGNIVSNDTKIQVWQNPYQADGLMFMAAPFAVKHAKAGEVDVYCYFFEEDTSLFETYLPATVEYVNMYSEMIGPYPYKRFTVAENFFPTGYGMPAWTLLGQQVIRLPFIVMTSLGHEVLHNWWGNSIYVDYDNGNWCEGLTVYGADYHYKLNRSPGSARAYRKDILKAYKNYVNEDNEFPVRDFVARHNAESRTIGYNKTMMIFHMIEEAIGTEAFFQAWRDIYKDNRGEKVTWEKWVAAYEASSGKDLGYIIPQWVDRVGAANINVELLDSEKKNGLTRVKFKVTQSDDLYNLTIPVRFLGIEGQDESVDLTEKEATFEFTVDGDATAFELDPNYNLFRHLYPQEIEPTVAAVLGSPEKHFVSYTDSEESNTALKTFGENMTEEEVHIERSTSLVGREGAFTMVLLNPDNLPPSLQQLIQVSPDEISISGKAYPRNGHTFVLSVEEKEIFARMLVLITDDLASLPRIGELVPHYGKYSYLVFKGARNVGKGQWPALTSPLRVAL